MAGKLQWFVPDGFMSPTQKGEFVSHEAICVLNTSDVAAHITLDVYFEDQEPLLGFSAVCPARRTNHIRLDRLVGPNGETIPKGTCYAVVLNSDVPVVAQHSRMDVSQAEMALMTTIPFGQ